MILALGALIEIQDLGEKIHTFKNWGCAIGNNNYIGEPETETYYIDIPGADGFLDGSEALTGRPIYKSRPINILLGGKKPRDEWDDFISSIRNKIHGRIIKITFDNDTGFYYTGRGYIKDFNRNREIGQFYLSIPKADPYKYSVTDSLDDWLWDPFDFETGIIDKGANISVSGEMKYIISASGGPFVPVFNVKNILSAGLQIEYSGKTRTLTIGRNRFPDIVVYKSDVTIILKGAGTLNIEYRRGSL